MSHKTKKMHGEVVSKEEVSKELGHPSEWLELHMRLEFEKHQTTAQKALGETSLDITGIHGRGCPSMPGYLGWLRKELEHPIGTRTGLISPEDEAKLLEKSQAVIRAEIAAQEARLAELERDPAAVRAHIERVRWWMDTKQSMGPMDPEDQPVEELVELAKQDVIDHTRDMEGMRQEVERCLGLLARIEDRKP